MLLRFICLFVLTPLVTVQAQVTGCIERFDDGILTGWEEPHPVTFHLTEANGVLRIDYNRMPNTWEWDNFNYSPPATNINATPRISLRAKSNVLTELTLKPIYTDGRNDWVQAYLPADNLWHTYVFELSRSGSTIMNRIYFYLDGGAKTPKSGIVYFDDLAIGDSVRVSAASKVEELVAAINATAALLANSEEGDGIGQYPAGSKAALQSAQQQARVVYQNPLATDGEVEQAIWDLYDACVTFESAVRVGNPGLIDSLATAKTKYLYLNLERLRRDYLLFGMHDATGYGVGWSGDDDRSDVKDVCGDYPAIYSWDLNAVDQDREIDRFTYRIRAAHARGGINTLSWHQYDPKNRSFYAANINNERIVVTLLPGGVYHQFYRNRLRKIAAFFKSLRGEDGHSIPIIFRPYHEHDGAWFWWGVGHATTQEYNDLWRFTVTFLRDSLNVHNLIYAISPSSFNSQADYLKIFPGDDVVDIFGMDFYFSQTPNMSEEQLFLSRLRVPAQLALSRGKIAALTEVGQETLPTATWFTQYLLPPLKEDSLASTLSYAAVWRNAHEGHFFAPYPGQITVADFIQFYQDPYTLFNNDLPDMFGPSADDLQPPEFVRYPAEPFTATDTTITLSIETNERAFLRYGPHDAPYAGMPHEFSIGQGGLVHLTQLHGEQGRTYNCFIRAVDFAGNETPQSTMVTFTVDTLQKPVYWYEPIYDITNWPQGNAPLGYNSSENVTVTSEAKTVYFRATFTLQQAVGALGILVKCHDGAVVYLNGKEIARLNMPTEGQIGYDTPATGANKINQVIILNREALRSLNIGENVLAVEVHAALSAPADLSFDARVFNQSGIFLDLGADWHYYDAGKAPKNLTIGDVLVPVVAPQAREPLRFYLAQNHPNPFNPVTTIRYELSSEGNVRIQVFDLKGQEVATLLDTSQAAGEYQIPFDGRHLASGIYFYRLQTDGYSAVRRMLLLK